MELMQTATMGGTLAAPTQVLTADLYPRFISFVDAKPKTIQTYTRALRQFAEWLSSKGISAPTREDILSYREELKEDHKPTTVQIDIVAVRLFFRWTAQEGFYPNVARCAQFWMTLTALPSRGRETTLYLC